MMTRSAPLLQAYADEYQRRRLALPGQQTNWMRDHRDSAMSRVVDLGLPTRKNEAWKYTSLQPLVDTPFALAENSTAVDRSQIAPLLLDNAYHFVLVDGRYAPQLSSLNNLPAGVHIASLATALNINPDLVKPWLGHHTMSTENLGVALNSALLQDGVFLRFEKDTLLDRPIQVLHIGAGIGMNNTTRSLLVASSGSRATVYESFFSISDGAYLTNAITEVFVAENAAIEMTKLVRENNRVLHLGGLYCTLERDAAFHHNNIALGAALVRNDLRVNLVAPGGHVQLNGLHMTRDRQHVDNQITVEHRAAHCSSQQYYKGVLADSSRGVFAGRILVQVNAQKTDAQQTNHTLLLSKEADANSKPQLEIYADDVKCSHGATVGQLDDEALFYLRSRGMGKQEARAALIQAFARDVINRIGNTPLRDPIWHEVERLQPT